MESRNNQNETPLVKAFKNGNLEVVKYFAPKGMISEKSRSNEVTENINVKNKKCTPIRKIVFAKNQKTGSSTLQNIFIRYGLKNQLRFAIPNNPSVPWAYSLTKSFHDSMVKTYCWKKKCHEFDMMLFYGIYNISETKKIIPKNSIAKRVTIIRDPLSVFESGYIYHNLDEKYGMNINQFAKNISENNFPPRRKSNLNEIEHNFNQGEFSHHHTFYFEFQIHILTKTLYCGI